MCGLNLHHMVLLNMSLYQLLSAKLFADGSQARLLLQNLGCFMWKDHGNSEVEVGEG